MPCRHPWKTVWRWAWIGTVSVLISACGGSAPDNVTYEGGGGTTVAPKQAPESSAEASRFLAQGTFGPRMTEIDALMANGYENWLQNQFAQPISSMQHYFARRRRADPEANENHNWVYNGFWQQAASANDQLRQRVAFALSQIFVISIRDGNVGRYPRGVASYYDMLSRNAFGNFRTLLQDVTLHPLMGEYLSHRGNEKADPETGRVPDENYAREVMQLFTIGLYRLNPDGTAQLDSLAEPIETYTNADVEGLAKVMTGFSWWGPDTVRGRFRGWIRADGRELNAMMPYPEYHSTEPKTFLGLTIPAQSTPDPMASLNQALDHLFAHPNVGPFISKQLIQRLVSSNPSPAFVRRVTAQFNDNGEGTRGDMRAVIRAILFDPEARNDALVTDASSGRLREPVLRMAHWMRSFNAASDSRLWMINSTDDEGKSLGQSVMRSPSVFNFYRPGYTPPSTPAGDAGLVAPEMQITNETSVVGWANVMRSAIPSGYGSSRDVKANYTAELALADQPGELIERINVLLFHGAMSNTLRSRLTQAVDSVSISSTNASSAARARQNRVNLAVFLAMIAPEYLVLK